MCIFFTLTARAARRRYSVLAILAFLLILPAYTAAAPPSYAAPGQPGPQAEETSNRRHTVRPGDTLFSLARRYGLAIEEIRRANGLEGNLIVTGRELVIPASPGKAPAPVPLPPVGETLSELLETALGFLGMRYQLGGNGRGGIDCSGLVRETFRTHGMDLPRTSREQFGAGTPVSRREARPGDLFFYRNNRSAAVSHVGIYLGGNRLLHASSNARRVVVSEISGNPWYSRNFLGARRVIPAEEETPEG